MIKVRKIVILLGLSFLVLMVTSFARVKIIPTTEAHNFTGKWRVTNYISINRVSVPEQERYEGYLACTNSDVIITDSSIRFEAKEDCYPNFGQNVKFSFKGKRNLTEDSLLQGERFVFYLYKQYGLRQIPVYSTDYTEPNCYSERNFIELYMITDDLLVIPYCDETLIVLKRYTNNHTPRRDKYEPNVKRRK